MSDPAPQGELTPFYVRMRSLSLRVEKLSSEPLKLYQKKSGVFLQSFTDHEALHAFVMRLPESRFQPTQRR